MCESEGREKKTDKTRVAMLQQTVDRMGLRKKNTLKKKPQREAKSCFFASERRICGNFQFGTR